MLLAPGSHKFILGVTAGGEFCWVIPDFPLVILKFSKEKCTTCSFSSAWKNCPTGAFYKVIVTDQRLRKTWETNHKNHNAEKLQSKEEKETTLSGCLEIGWVLLEDCFFLCSELFLSPQCKFPSPGTDWAENCPIPAVHDGINISNWNQIHVLQPTSHQILLQTCKHSAGTLPIHTVLSFLANKAQHHEDRADNRTWEQISTVKKGFKLEGSSFSKTNPMQEVDSGSINSFPDVMSLPVRLYLLKRSKRPRVHTHC